MKIFVVVLNFNGGDFILDCLTSLEDVKKPKGATLEFVVVDNNSTDGSVKAIKEKFPQVTFLESKVNLGFAEGNNVGLRYAVDNGADEIIVLNPDTVVDQDLVINLDKIAQKNPKAGILGPKIYFAPGYEFHKGKYQKSERGKVIWYAGGVMDWDNVLASHHGVDEVDRGQHEKIGKTDFISGCCMMVKREVFENIGFFDSRYFLYWEDNDFSQRAKKAGFGLLYVPGAHLWHLNAGTTGGSGSHLHDYYTTRNRLLYGLSYTPWRARFALFRESLKLLVAGRPWQRKGVIDFYLRKFGKGSYHS